MKKYLLLLILPFLFLTDVKADTIINTQYGGSNYSELYYLNNLTWNSWYDYNDEQSTQHNCNGKEDCYNQALSYFSSLNYQYYSMFVTIYPGSGTINLTIIPFNFSSSDTYTQNVYSSGGSSIDRFYYYKGSNTSDIIGLVLSGWSDPNYNNFYKFYDSNYNFINNDDYIFKGFYDNENDNYNNMLQIHDGQSIPKIKDLLNYNSWSDYENNHLENYTTVNLDNYEYVLLSLKNYGNISPFQTNLQVKGQIGITPIYNYGQTSKDAITGSQVQDRCNVEYSDFTTYPFYIIQSDIQNNAIFAIKSCSSGSSFKFDNTIFDITYITSQNLDNPTITINGNTYNVIPYDDLPSTATQNEEDNYIPGQSGSATDTGGLDSAIKNVQQKMSEIWNTFTYFTDFIGQMFSTLPEELRIVLISAFTVAIILGLIKIFIN